MMGYKTALNVPFQCQVTENVIKLLHTTTVDVMSMKSSSPINYKYMQNLPLLRIFTRQLIVTTDVYTPLLLVTMCYLNRLKKDCPKLLSSVCRRFLAYLILNSKYHNGSSLLNRH